MKILSLLGILFIHGCSNEDNTYMRCQNVDDVSHEHIIELTRNRLIHRTFLVFGKNCDSKIERDMENRFEYLYVNGKISLLVHELTPLSAKAAQYFNKTKVCGLKDWKVNEPRNQIDAGCSDIHDSKVQIHPYGSGIEVIMDQDSFVYKKKP